MKPSTPTTSPASPASSTTKTSPFAMYKPMAPIPTSTTTTTAVPTPTATATTTSPMTAAPTMFRPQMPTAMPTSMQTSAPQPQVMQPMMVPRPPMPMAAMPVATTQATAATTQAPMPVATAAAPRPQLMTPAAMPGAAQPPVYGDSPAVTPSLSRPKPEKMTTSLASELQHLQQASAEEVATLTTLITELLGALQQRVVGTADEVHVRDTATKLHDLLQHAAELPSDCAEALEQYLRQVAQKDVNAAASLVKITKNYAKSLSATTLTGLRFLQRLAAKYL